MSSGSNKHLKLLDQGIAAFVFEPEDGIPILRDNPLLVAPWRDELEDYLSDKDSRFPSLWTAGVLIDSKGITFSTFEQATDYNLGVMPRTFTFKKPAPLVYVRPPTVAAAHTIKKTVDLDISTLPSRQHVSIEHVRQASLDLCGAICTTVHSKATARNYKLKYGRDGLAILAGLDAESSVPARR